jgi:hypothetical protein
MVPESKQNLLPEIMEENKDLGYHPTVAIIIIIIIIIKNFDAYYY